MCDVRDLGRSVGDKSATWHATLGRGGRGVRYSTGIGQGEREVDIDALETFQPTIFLYDAYPGGIGLSTALYDLAPRLLAATHSLITGCTCPEGCPSCVGPVGEVSRTGKATALEILAAVLGSAERESR
jgi:DEAD/DEAH box helicase domain-containing protein